MSKKSSGAVPVEDRATLAADSYAHGLELIRKRLVLKRIEGGDELYTYKVPGRHFEVRRAATGHWTFRSPEGEDFHRFSAATAAMLRAVREERHGQ